MRQDAKLVTSKIADWWVKQIGGFYRSRTGSISVAVPER
jgi:hypothetical protein